MAAAAPAVALEELEAAQLVRERIQRHLPTVTTFDPLTLLAIVGFVCRVLQVCEAAAVLRKQAAIARKPAGAVADRMLQRLRAKYAEDHRSEAVDLIAVDFNLRAAMKAFAEATPDELRQIKAKLDRANNQPTQIELFKFTAELSGID